MMLTGDYKAGKRLKCVWHSDIGHMSFGPYDYVEMSGFGHYFWPNGDLFSGEWKNGDRHGEGTRFHLDGIEKKDVYENDCPK